MGYFLDSVQQLSGVSEGVANALMNLANLYVLEGIEAHPGDFLEVSSLLFLRLMKLTMLQIMKMCLTEIWLKSQIHKNVVRYRWIQSGTEGQSVYQSRRIFAFFEKNYSKPSMYLSETEFNVNTF